jgi:hypothetical protein
VIPQRAHPRYAHEAAVTVHVNGCEYQGRTKNVSRGGLCADLAETIPVGDVELDLQLVFEEGTQSEPLRVPGRVVWCTMVDEGCQIGVSFRPMDKELTEYLTMFLRFLDDGTPPLRTKRESNLDKRFD